MSTGLTTLARKVLSECKRERQRRKRMFRLTDRMTRILDPEVFNKRVGHAPHVYMMLRIEDGFLELVERDAADIIAGRPYRYRNGKAIPAAEQTTAHS